MGHECIIQGTSAACFEQNNELWVKEYGDRYHGEGRTYTVKFCPECGFSFPKKCYSKSFFNSVNISDYTPDDSITQFSQTLSNAIAQMNYNVELIKSFMSTQTSQNGCFLDTQIEFNKRLESLEKSFWEFHSIQTDS